jgi:hypothetical protein
MMNKDQLTQFEVDFDNLIKINSTSEKGIIEEIAELVNKYNEKTGQKMQLELKIDNISINIDGSHAGNITSLGCIRIPCPPRPSCPC